MNTLGNQQDLIGKSAVTIRDYGTTLHKHKLVLELTQRGFSTDRPPRWLALYGYLWLVVVTVMVPVMVTVTVTVMVMGMVMVTVTMTMTVLVAVMVIVMVAVR